MDILAHMLWANYGARVVNKKLQKNSKRSIKLPEITFWGVFPDLFAFGIPLFLSIPKIIQTGFILERPSSFGISAVLYQYSHSLVIWLIVFSIVWIFFKKPRLELFGWALHILIDIPSHSGTFFPTPFLFPISDYRFLNGISWGNTTFMIINYSLLLLVSIYFFFLKKNKIAPR